MCVIARWILTVLIIKELVQDWRIMVQKEHARLPGLLNVAALRANFQAEPVPSTE